MPFSHKFKVPEFPSVDSPWGPPAEVPESLRFNDVPYAPYSKSDKLGKPADWVSFPQKDSKDNKRTAHGHRDPYHAYGASSAVQFLNNEGPAEKGSFSLVDNSRVAKPRQATVLKAKTGGRNNQNQRTNQGQRSQNNNQQRSNNNFTPRKRFVWREERPQKHRDASVQVGSEWQLIQSNGFNELQKLSFDVKPGTTISRHGYVYPYNRNLDKPNVSTKLKHPERSIYNVTTSDDPVIQQFVAEDAATIFVTDSILSIIMCTTKSVYPWDVIINKTNGKIFFDKRDDSPVDMITVDENTYDPPSDTADKSNINSASSLSYEATYINENFAANAIEEVESKRVNFEHENPFYKPEEDEDVDPPIPRGYIYRKFNLANSQDDEPLNLIVRTKVDAVTPGKEDSLITVNALNEYGGPNGVLEWKTKLAHQRGAVVAAEVKKNLNKVSRWTVESILAGASTMKIGFVSRVSPKDNRNHIIVGVVGQIPEQFANQINLKISNGWGIFKSIVNIIESLDDGKYVLMKDPNASMIKIYKVPEDAFDENEEEENDA